MIETELLIADNMNTLTADAARWLARGWDLHGGLVVSGDSQAAQWIVHSNPHVQYSMVRSFSLAEYRRSVKSMQGDGWDLWQGAVWFRAALYQWMCRSLRPDDAISYALPFTQQMQPVLTLVEDAQQVLRILPYPLESFSHPRA